VCTFVVFHVLPSADPALLRAGPRATPDVVEQMRTNMGLDKPLPEQLLRYLERLILHFDLGTSLVNDASIRHELAARLPVTTFLTLGAGVVCLAIAIPLGLAWGRRPSSGVDRFAKAFCVVGISVPVYWLGLLSLLLFSRDGRFVEVFPGPGQCPDLRPIECLSSFALPWIVLGVTLAAFYAPLVRVRVVETMTSDYIRTARAKGLPEWDIAKHALRGALTPLVSRFGVDFGMLLGGAVLVEQVFNLPGIGRYAARAITLGDLSSIQGTVLVGGILVIGCNLAVDLLYPALDPRLRGSPREP
jgi:peptide/nickel transport system permease protein